MYNELVFLTQISVILTAVFGAFLLDRHVLAGVVCLYTVFANIFVSKQMVLFGLVACGGGMYMVGGICGLLLLQTVWGKEYARSVLLASFGLSLLFFLLSWVQCAYAPASVDTMHNIFIAVLSRVPRITLASLGAHFLAQLLTLRLQSLLVAIFKNQFVFVMSTISMLLGQLLDSLLFFSGSFYGDASWQVIAQMVSISIGIKTTMILCSSWLVSWAAKRKHTRDV